MLNGVRKPFKVSMLLWQFAWTSNCITLTLPVVIKQGWYILISRSQDKLPIEYTATIDRAKGSWTGTAKIPIDYFPPGVHKINAYAIHGSGINRMYESLYPASADAKSPDLWVALQAISYVTLKMKHTTLITAFKTHSGAVLSFNILFAILELQKTYRIYSTEVSMPNSNPSERLGLSNVQPDFRHYVLAHSRYWGKRLTTDQPCRL